ncbi:MFS transporter [Streptomyces sp. NPDC015220]|uniref:MFS transporter n=1 Tax=Streptomyces sp. NPDC015220 TaxID=3364947 RepID=UPI0036FB274B
MNVRSGGRVGAAPEAGTGTQAGPVSGKLGFGLALILAAQFMIMLDSSIVAVAIPHIQRDLGFSPEGVQAVVAAYNTAFGGALILCGRVGDLLGRRRVLIVGMLGFALTSLLCGLARSATELVAFRALQGLSAAIIAPTALSLLTTLVPEGPQRVKAMSKFGIATVLGFISGLVCSGLLVSAWGWKGVFFATVPVGVLGAVLIPRFIRPVDRLPHRIDVVGAVLITASVSVLVAAPTRGAQAGWTSGEFLLLPAIGVVLFAAFLWYENRHDEPLVKLSLFRSRTLRAANVVSLCSGISSGTAYLLTTMYLQDVRDFSPVKAGLFVAPVGVLNIAFGFVIGRLITRYGLRASITAATLLSGLFVALVAGQVSPTANLTVFAVVLLPMGMAFMAGTVTSTLAATSGVAPQEQGLAAGVRQTSFQLGIALGVAVLVPLASRDVGTHGGAGVAAQELADGVRSALLVLAAVVVAAGVVAFTGVRRPAAGKDA